MSADSGIPWTHEEFSIFAASFAAHYIGSLKEGAEERERNAPVPCQWPDIQTAQASGSDQVEYGSLCVSLCRLRSTVPGRWKPRAILEHDGSLTELNLSKWPILGSGAGGPEATLRSDLSLMAQPCEAILHLIYEPHSDSNQSPGEHDKVLLHLGSIRLGPFAEPRTTRMDSCLFKDGAAEIDLIVTFSREHLHVMLEERILSKWSRVPSHDLGSLELLRATDIDAFYLMATVCAEDYRQGSATFSLDSPWILPVRFVYRSPGHLHLLSPFSGNRHLLGLVQKRRQVSNEKARLYAVQLVYTLESLHDLGIVALLNPENILLDVFGNIRIITPRLFTTDQNFGLNLGLSQSLYTAPEVLRGEAPTRLTDWWMLGALLHEILTGLSPFYHQNEAERDRKTLEDELNIPTHVQGVTADILGRLLDRDPTHRLGGGASGVSEIKKHDFFLGVDWQDPSPGCSELTPFQPPKAENILKYTPKEVTAKPPRQLRESEGYVYEQYRFGAPPHDRQLERIIGRQRSSSDIFNPALSVQADLGPDQAAADALQADSGRQGSESEPVMARLKAALQTKESTEQIASILEGCASDVLATVLASPILLVNITPITTIAPTKLSREVSITALEWAVELGREDLVCLLLGRGADPNYTFDERYGPALTRAARERRTQLVEILAPKTSRILALRTLCLAVEQRDVATVTCLLSCGVPCDFDAADHPLPAPRIPHHEAGFCGTDYSHIWDFFPSPVVRAARHGDAAMVRLLLSFGADPNTAYHALSSLAPEWHASWQEAAGHMDSWNAGFVCGRVVQLAMQLGHGDVVDALLEHEGGGADIGLVHPEWPGPEHFCPTVPRGMHLRITAELEEVANAKGRGG